MEAQRELTREDSSRADKRSALNQAFEWLLLIWTGSIPLMIWFHIRFQKYTIPAADFIFVIELIAFLAALLWGQRRWRIHSWQKPLLAYAGALVLSAVFSQNVRQSLPKAAGDIYLLIAAAMTIQYVQNLEALRKVVLAWITGVAITAAGAIAGLGLFFLGKLELKNNPFLSRFGTLPPGHYPRIRATFLDPNMMCSYVTCGIMLLIAARRMGWIPETVFRILLFLSLLTAALAISPSLGGLCLALGLWVASENRSSVLGRIAKTSGILIAFVVFAGAPISFTPLARTTVIQTLLHPEPSGRLQTWIGAWHTFLAHPIFGQGLESDAAYVKYVVASGKQQTLTNAHNTWLSILAQQGIVGALAFAWVIFHLVRRFHWECGPAGKETGMRFALELALLGGVLYSTLAGSFENTRHAWALMGLVAAIQDLPESVRADAATAG